MMLQRLDDVFETVPEKISAVVAASMIGSPIWRSWLEGVSEIAALLAPPLGCLWLMIQIYYKISRGK